MIGVGVEVGVAGALLVEVGGGATAIVVGFGDDFDDSMGDGVGVVVIAAVWVSGKD